jgi:hypothetical protein
MSEAKATANEKWVGDMMDLLKERDSLLARNKKLVTLLTKLEAHCSLNMVCAAPESTTRNFVEEIRQALAENMEQADDVRRV